MRSKIEANEYKDYILGFIFYRFLSEKELQWLIKNGFEQDEIEALDEDDKDILEYIRSNLGYCRESRSSLQKLFKIYRLFKPHGLYNMTMRVNLYDPFLYEKKGRTQYLTPVPSSTHYASDR